MKYLLPLLFLLPACSNTEQCTDKVTDKIYENGIEPQGLSEQDQMIVSFYALISCNYDYNWVWLAYRDTKVRLSTVNFTSNQP